MSGELHKLPLKNELFIKFFQFVGGFSLNLFIGNTLQAATNKPLPDLVTNPIGQRILEISAGFTPYINARAGEAITYRIAKMDAKDRELLIHRFKIARDAGEIDLNNGEIENLIDKKIPEARLIINEAKANKKFIDAKGLAKKVDGLSEDAARVLLDENSKGANVWFLVENSNIIGIMLAGATTLLPIPLPAQPFFAQLAQSGIGYATAVATEKAVPVMRRKFGEWWSNAPEKDGERQLLLNQETGERRLRYGEDNDAMSLHSSAANSNREDSDVEEAPQAPTTEEIVVVEEGSQSSTSVQPR